MPAVFKAGACLIAPAATFRWIWTGWNPYMWKRLLLIMILPEGVFDGFGGSQWAHRAVVLNAFFSLSLEQILHWPCAGICLEKGENICLWALAKPFIKWIHEFHIVTSFACFQDSRHGRLLERLLDLRDIILHRQANSKPILTWSLVFVHPVTRSASSFHRSWPERRVLKAATI